MLKPLLLGLTITSLFSITTNAQSVVESQEVAEGISKKKPYITSNIDGYIFSTALINDNGVSSLGTLRFTAFFNFGANLNYDFSKSLGIYTGLNVKNIGFIEKFEATGVTEKHRVYTIGVPLGLKIGNLSKKQYFMIGGGVDFPFNYKNKRYVAKKDKVKYNEWFGDRVNPIMPYVFVGARFKPGISIKAQYYPTNFFNQDYQYFNGANFVNIYENKEVNLLLFTLGFDINYSSRF